MVFDDYKGLAIAIATRYARTSPLETFDDIYAEASLAIVETLPKFNGRGNIRGFLYSRVNFRVIDYLRQCGSRGNSDRKVDTAQIHVDDMAFPNQLNWLTTEQKFDTLTSVAADAEIEVATDVALCLRAAPPRARAMIKLKLQGYSNTEIGVLYDLTHARISQLTGPYLKRYIFPLLPAYGGRRRIHPRWIRQ